MVIRIIFGLFSGALAGGFWFVASSLANYMDPNYNNPTIFPITYALVLTLAIYANSIARVWGWSFLLSSLACFYMPVATFIGASKGAIAIVESTQPGMEQAASAVGATIGTGLVTALTGFVGFFLGLFLLVLAYFLLRTSRADLVEIQNVSISGVSIQGLASPSAQRIKYVIVTLLSIGMLISAFSTVISSPKKSGNEMANSDSSSSTQTIQKAAAHSSQKTDDPVSPKTFAGKWAGEPWTCENPISITESGKVIIDGVVSKAKFANGALQLANGNYLSFLDDRKVLRYAGIETEYFDLKRCP